MRSFCISQAGPKSNDKCHIKDILRRDTQGKGGQSQWDGGRGRSDAATAEDARSQQWRGKGDIPPFTFRGGTASSHPDSRPVASRSLIESFLLLQATKVVIVSYGNPRSLKHMAWAQDDLVGCRYIRQEQGQMAYVDLP